MKTLTKVIAAIIGAATLASQVPAVQLAVTSFLGKHAGVALVVGGISSILALFHNPSAN